MTDIKKSVRLFRKFRTILAERGMIKISTLRWELKISDLELNEYLPEWAEMFAFEKIDDQLIKISDDRPSDLAAVLSLQTAVCERIARVAHEYIPFYKMKLYELSMKDRETIKEYIDMVKKLNQKTLESLLNPHLWYCLARIQHGLRIYSDAEFLYKLALKQAPQFAPTWNSYGWYLYSVKKAYDEAERHFLTAIQTDPNFPASYINLGQLYHYTRNNTQRAVQLIIEAVERVPTYAYGWNLLGDLYDNSLRDRDKAEICYRKWVELDSQSYDAWNTLGEFLKRTHRDPEYREICFQNARRFSPPIPPIRDEI